MLNSKYTTFAENLQKEQILILIKALSEHKYLLRIIYHIFIFLIFISEMVPVKTSNQNQN